MSRTLTVVAAALLCSCGGSGGASPDAADASTSFAADTGGVPPHDGSSSSDAAVASDAGAGTSPDGAPAPSCAAYRGAGAASTWVYADATGKFQYKPLSAKGDHIMDFSSSGYMGGGVAIPTVAVKRTVTPSGGDDTAAIQSAIDAVSALPLTDGVRGAVLLAPGAFTLAGVLTISAAGVVLRGSGSGANGTVVTATGAGREILVIHGSGSATLVDGASANITDAYAPSGSTSFHVDDATKLAVGDTVFVQRPVTEAWIHFMGMDTLVRDGAAQTWLEAGTVHQWDRVVSAISGNEITVDVPISDSLDATYVSPPGASIAKFTNPGRIAQVGVEDIQFECPVRSATAEFELTRIDSVIDGWLRGLVIHNFTNGVWLGPEVKRFTVEDVAVTHDATTYTTSEAPFDFWIDAQQTLVQRSSSSGGNKIWYYATQNVTRGPNVLLSFTATGTASHVTGHQRWATGQLVDGSNIVGGTTFQNNGDFGTGEGWSMGWGVIWNTKSDVLVEAPPGAMNWAIGNTGGVLAGVESGDPAGTYESMNAPVTPASLYLAQLCERLGPQAVTAIGD